MGVHDNMDSKYSVMGGGSSFSKLTPKRPIPIVFGDNNNPSNSKKQKSNEDGNCSKTDDNQTPKTSEQHNQTNVTVNNNNIQQQRKSLPVYRLRKRLVSIYIIYYAVFRKNYRRK